MSLPDRARAAILAALDSMVRAGELEAEARGGVETERWVVERPKRPEHGDLATNVAMALAKRAGKPPRAIAESLVAALRRNTDGVVVSAEVAGPGFVNLRLNPAAFHEELADVLRAGAAWGLVAASGGERVNIEFVSANPTGPVTVASGRNAVLGDAVAAPPRGDRPPRHARVLHQRSRQPGAHVRGERPRGGDRRRAAGGRVQGGLRRRARVVAAAHLARDPRRRRPRGPRADLRDVDAEGGPRVRHAPRNPSEPRRAARELRRLRQRGLALPLGRRPRRDAPARRGRLPPAQGRRALLPGTGRRARRQGPRRPEEQRRVGLLRFGHRVLRRQDRTWIRPLDQRPRRRSPRVRGARSATRSPLSGWRRSASRRCSTSSSTSPRPASRSRAASALATSSPSTR